MNAVRFGLIGYCAWGSHHARAIAGTPGAVLTAVAVPSEASRARVRTEHPAARVYADYHELLGHEELDVVDVVLPSNLHTAAAMAALEAGRHVLVEKPMALALTDCDRLIERARDRRRVLAVGHELRHSSLWGKVKELVDGGAVGTPLYVLVGLWRRPYRPGSEGWRYDANRVGNWTLEEAVHFFDLARWYLGGAGAPVAVCARANGRQAGHPELQDNFSALVDFPGGVYAVITQTLAAYEHHQTVQLTGTDGALWARWSGALDRDPHPSFALTLHQKGQTTAVPIARPAGELHELEDEIAMMVRAVRAGTPVAATGEDGRWAVALCLAAQQSAATGAVVPV
jgi:myo-inositol 2-dehydrogenase/D-chiro-inositol 1-dehydrogenase